MLIVPAKPSVAVRRGERTAGRALNEPWVERMARVGILSRAVDYLVLCVLVTLILLGRGNHEVDGRGALEAIGSQPFGRVLLLVLCAGFLAYIAWQLLRAVTRRPDQGDRANLGRRLIALGTVVIYAGLLFSALGLVFGGHSSSTQRSQQTLTAGLLSDSGGRAVVVAGGCVLIGIGLAMFVHAAMRRFETALDSARMGSAMRRVANVLGVAGQAGRGLVFIIIGGFVVSAGVARDARQSKGLDAGLHTLAEQRFGAIMLGVVALGFLAFGLFSLIDARYREDFRR